MRELAFHRALEALWRALDHANKYVVETAPFTLAKDEAALPRVGAILHELCEALRVTAQLLAPFMPETARGSRLSSACPERGARRARPRLGRGVRRRPRPLPPEPLFPRVEERPSERRGARRLALPRRPSRSSTPTATRSSRARGRGGVSRPSSASAPPARSRRTRRRSRSPARRGGALAVTVGIHPHHAEHRRRRRARELDAPRPRAGRRRRRRDRARLLLRPLAPRRAAQRPSRGRSRSRGGSTCRSSSTCATRTPRRARILAREGAERGRRRHPLLHRRPGTTCARTSTSASTSPSPASSPSRTPSRSARPSGTVPLDRLLVETDSPYLAPVPTAAAATSPPKCSVSEVAVTVIYHAIRPAWRSGLRWGSGIAGRWRAGCGRRPCRKRWRCGPRSSSRVPRAKGRARWHAGWASRPIPSACGVGATGPKGCTACAPARDRGRPVGSATRRSGRWWRPRCARRRPPRIGARAVWPRRSRTSRRPRCIGSGRSTGCSRIGSRPSSAVRILSSRRRWPTSSGSISIRRSARWCCASMRSRRSRRSTARSRSCRCARGCRPA